MAKEKINNQIRKLRFEQGEMTQQQLANLCGCTRQTIISLEQERYWLLYTSCPAEEPRC